jgi:hypothetical protein
MGRCVKCDAKTDLEFSEDEINYHGYLCGKCRGYKSDEEYVKDIEYANREFAKIHNPLHKHIKKDKR